MYCRQCNKTFISYTAIRSDARQENLATLIGEGASLVEIRAALAIDSTGFSRELQNCPVALIKRNAILCFPRLTSL